MLKTSLISEKIAAISLAVVFDSSFRDVLKNIAPKTENVTPGMDKRPCAPTQMFLFIQPDNLFSA